MPCWSHSMNRTGELQTCGTACHGSARTGYGRPGGSQRRPRSRPPATARQLHRSRGRRAGRLPGPSGRVLDKVIQHLDEHCTAFIRLSPFATLATASPDGWPEVSPRGGEPGFVRVLDSSHLALPDRQGNNRIDSLRNGAENPRAALMFFAPGIDETLRVYGTTSLVPTGALGIDVTEFGRQPLSVLVLEVERAYFQCSKAVMRSGLWDPERRVERSTFPPFP